MANYFRETFHLFEGGGDIFAHLDYILRRQLSELQLRYFDDWREGFLRGLKAVTEQRNSYIAAVFHNVLATYYLNRVSVASHYQIERLAERTIILDTNVLYALLVPASNFHELVSYLVGRLAALGASIRVFPFTVEEYESSLKHVVHEYNNGQPTAQLIARNPWLYQEFKRDEARYMNSIAACRMKYSVARDEPVNERSFSEIEQRLQEHGVSLQRAFQVLDAAAVEERWVEFRNAMANDKWNMEEYWNFIQKPVREEVIRHDVLCVENVGALVANSKRDDLGPKVLLVTLDRRKLLRLRRKYDYIIGAEQFLGFMLPYLFMSDIPVKDAELFPNTILSAQLGTLLVKRPPEVAEVAYGYLKNPEFFDQPGGKIYSEATGMGMALSSERFRLKRIAEATKEMSEEEIKDLARGTGDILSDLALSARRKARQGDEIGLLRSALEEQGRRSEKLQKSLKYWREQARRN